MNMENGSKIKNSEYIDYSDYGRGLGIGIAMLFKNSSVRAWHLTVSHFMVMCAASLCVSFNTEETHMVAAILIMFKNVMDAADGSLARLQERPSRVGRFLDSNLDFLGNLIFFLSLQNISLLAALSGFLFFTFQGSVFNYYSVLYRMKQQESDKTSYLDESEESPYKYDNPAVLKILFYFYVVFYKWQDNIISDLDKWVTGGKCDTPGTRFMEFASFLGPGFQYIFIIFMLMAGEPDNIPDVFYLLFNAWLVVLVFSRASQSGDHVLGE